MSRKLRIEYPGKGSTVDYSQQLRLSEAVWGWFWMDFFACPGVVIPTRWHHAARHASGISWRDLSRDGSWGPPGGHFHNWHGQRGKVRAPPLGPWTTPTQTCAGRPTMRTTEIPI